MLRGSEETHIWGVLLQQTIRIIGGGKEDYTMGHLPIEISYANGSMVITMYGAKLLVRRNQVYGRQIVTVGDGFGSNFFTTLLW